MLKKDNNYLTILFIFIPISIAVLFFHISPSQYISDDSVFYLVIAQQIVEFKVSTFNGYIDTNGYHPLWMLFSIISIYISNIFDFNPLNIIGIFYQLFFFASIYIILKINKLLDIYYESIVSIILLFLFVSNGALHNMESSLALFFVVLTIYYMLLPTEISLKFFFNLGILIGLTLLSRLDLIFFCLLLVGFVIIIYYQYFISKLKYLLVFIIGGLLIVIPYFVYNELSFGSITPVSGALKSSFPHIELSLRNIFPYGIISMFFSFIGLGIVIFDKKREVKILYALLSISTIFHAFYLIMFQDDMSWYYITGYLTIALVFGYFLKKIDTKLIINIILLILISGTLVTSYIKGISDYTISNHLLKGKQLNFAKISQMQRFSEELKKKLPNKSTIFTWDLPGFLSYYGDFKVFSADGLITNKQYQIELLEMGAIKVFNKYNISYILVPLTNNTRKYYDGMLFKPLKDDRYSISIYSRLYHKKVGTLLLSKKDLIFKIRSPYSGTSDKSALIGVFKIPK